ncbi:MAG: glycosyltransferase family A protein [candidate division WOR-3 bacterium]
MVRPLLSIFMQAFNEHENLQETLESLLGQTFKDFILYCIDNGSNDNTFSIIKDFASKDKRVIPIRIEENDPYIGYKMMLKAKTKFCQFAAGHDIYKSTFIEKCIHELENSADAVLAYPLACYLYKDNRIELIEPIFNICFNTPYSRFISVLTLCHYNYPIYGIIRANVFNRLSTKCMVPGIDHILLAEISLYGNFKLVGEPLLFLRQRKISGEVEDYSSYVKRHKFIEGNGLMNFIGWYETLKNISKDYVNGDIKSIFLIAALYSSLLRYSYIFYEGSTGEAFNQIINWIKNESEGLIEKLEAIFTAVLPKRDYKII